MQTPPFSTIPVAHVFAGISVRRRKYVCKGTATSGRQVSHAQNRLLPPILLYTECERIQPLIAYLMVAGFIGG